MAKGAVFVDTSAWYALASAVDPEHGAAKAVWALLLERGAELSTSDWVVSELIALSERRIGRETARRVGSLILGGDSVRMLYVDGRTLEGAWRGYDPASGPSLVDVVSFELMRLNGIEEFFAFDEGFSRAGFKPCG